MADVFGTAVSGLLSFQRALHTTSHNVANSATEGYSRQRVEFSARATSGAGGFSISSGVDVESVRRIHDEFVNTQILNYSSSYNAEETFFGKISDVDDLLSNEYSNLNMNLQKFFDGIHDVTGNPSSLPVRQVTLSDARNLVEQFNSLSGQIGTMRNVVNREIESAAGKINELAQAIAEINQQIQDGGLSSVSRPPNDLLDKRDLLVRQLSELVNVSTLQDKDGSLSVFIGNGQSLVLGRNYNSISTVPNYFDPEQPEVAFITKTASIPITSFIEGGTLGGLLDFRAEVLNNAENSIGRVAAGLASTFNQQHRLGMDLNGNYNRDFFVEPQPVAFTSSKNTGTGTISTAYTDVTQLTTADYQLTFNGANYTLRNLNDNSTATIPGGGPFPYDTGLGFSVNLGGAPAVGDSFLIRPTRQAARAIDLAIGDPREIAAAAPLRKTDAVGLNSDLQATLQINDYTDVNLTSAAVQIRIVSTSPDQYEMYNVTGGLPGVLMGSGAYNSGGMSFAMNGWQLNLSGVPQTGDIITIESNADGRGDNTNALALADLQTQDLLDQGTASYQDLYSALVADIGTMARQADTARQSHDVLLKNSVARREEVSGVNLDEEAADLLRFQQAYQAASRVLTTANLMFETLLNAVR